MASKSMKLGGGGRFAKGVSAMKSKGTPSKEAAAIMANAGRKKYGAAKMSKMAAAGKKSTVKSKVSTAKPAKGKKLDIMIAIGKPKGGMKIPTVKRNPAKAVKK